MRVRAPPSSPGVTASSFSGRVPAAGLSARLALTLAGLCAAIAARMARNPAIVPLLMLAWRRLGRTATRFATLAARAEAGTLPRPRAPRLRKPTLRKPTLREPPPRKPPQPGPDPDAAAAAPPGRQRLPGGRYWLVRLVPEANAFACQLQHWLADPELAALLHTAPQAGRLLRPLCRMLAIHPVPPLALPPRPKPPRSSVPRSRPLRVEKPESWPGRGSRELSPRTALRRLRALGEPSPDGLRPAGPFWKPA